MSRFDYVAYDNAATVSQGLAKDAVTSLEFIVDSLPRGPAQSLALTKLEECYMWIGKAIRDEQIARNGSAPLQEGRANA